MLRIRRLEETCVELYSASKIRGFLHVQIGEEAVAAGVMSALAPQDAVVATYREHGHALLRGVTAESILAEMYGKQEGCCRGRGGSMHLFDAATRFYGGNAIVAGGLPLAVGLALADKMQGRDRVTACFFGDGAVAEGEFHESLNLAALWQLPVLFVCENNLYAMGTALRYTESQTDVALKAAGYEIRVAADGMDVLAVAEAARCAVDPSAPAAARTGAAHLPLPRPLDVRPGAVPRQGRGGRLGRAGPDPALREAPAGRRRPLRRGLGGDAAGGRRGDGAGVAYAEAGTPEPVEELTRFVYSERSGHGRWRREDDLSGGDARRDPRPCSATSGSSSWARTSGATAAATP